MRIGPDTRFWIVTDPSSHSTEIEDIFFETTIRGLELQFRGGLTCERHPTLFTERGEAEEDARHRLKTWSRYQEELKTIVGRES